MSHRNFHADDIAEPPQVAREDWVLLAKLVVLLMFTLSAAVVTGLKLLPMEVAAELCGTPVVRPIVIAFLTIGGMSYTVTRGVPRTLATNWKVLAKTGLLLVALLWDCFQWVITVGVVAAVGFVRLYVQPPLENLSFPQHPATEAVLYYAWRTVTGGDRAAAIRTVAGFIAGGFLFFAILLIIKTLCHRDEVNPNGMQESQLVESTKVAIGASMFALILISKGEATGGDGDEKVFLAIHGGSLMLSLALAIVIFVKIGDSAEMHAVFVVEEWKMSMVTLMAIALMSVNVIHFIAGFF